jgi:hypothetical protein
MLRRLREGGFHGGGTQAGPQGDAWRVGGVTGVTMHRPNDAGYSHSDSYVIDDWR